MSDPIQNQPLSPTAESISISVFFLAYMIYLFINPEGELLHWLTLVLLPLTILFMFRRKDEQPLRSLFSSIGLDRDQWKQWLGWAILIGLVLSIAQLGLVD